MNQLKRSFRMAVAAAAGLAMAGCTTDPEFWDAVATGLDQAAYDIAQENAGCYWAPPPGLPYAPSQRYCPGDYGYREVYPLPAGYYRDQYRDGRDRDHRGGGRRDRDDRHGRDGGRRGDKDGKR